MARPLTAKPKTPPRNWPTRPATLPPQPATKPVKRLRTSVNEPKTLRLPPAAVFARWPARSVRTRREGMFGSAAGSVANALDHTGQYLQEEGLRGVAEDFTGLIRRNPIPALLIGVAVGFLLAKATSSRS